MLNRIEPLSFMANIAGHMNRAGGNSNALQCSFSRQESNCSFGRCRPSPHRPLNPPAQLSGERWLTCLSACSENITRTISPAVHGKDTQSAAKSVTDLGRLSSPASVSEGRQPFEGALPFSDSSR